MPIKMVVASDSKLTDDEYYRHLWLAASNLSMQLPRRGWLDELADCFRDFQDNIFTSCGSVFELGDLDEIFGDDPEARWLSTYLKADHTGTCPQIKSVMLDRLRVLDLYFKIRWPEIAQRF